MPCWSTAFLTSTPSGQQEVRWNCSARDCRDAERNSRYPSRRTCLPRTTAGCPSWAISVEIASGKGRRDRDRESGTASVRQGRRGLRSIIVGRRRILARSAAGEPVRILRPPRRRKKPRRNGAENKREAGQFCPSCSSNVAHRPSCSSTGGTALIWGGARAALQARGNRWGFSWLEDGRIHPAPPTGRKALDRASLVGQSAAWRELGPECGHIIIADDGLDLRRLPRGPPVCRDFPSSRSCSRQRQTRFGGVPFFKRAMSGSSTRAISHAEMTRRGKRRLQAAEERKHGTGGGGSQQQSTPSSRPRSTKTTPAGTHLRFVGAGRPMVALPASRLQVGRTGDGLDESSGIGARTECTRYDSRSATPTFDTIFDFLIRLCRRCEGRDVALGPPLQELPQAPAAPLSNGRGASPPACSPTQGPNPAPACETGFYPYETGRGRKAMARFLRGISMAAESEYGSGCGGRRRGCCSEGTSRADDAIAHRPWRHRGLRMAAWTKTGLEARSFAANRGRAAFPPLSTPKARHRVRPPRIKAETMCRRAEPCTRGGLQRRHTNELSAASLPRVLSGPSVQPR